MVLPPLAYVCNASGLKLFGLSDPVIRVGIESLPGASQCHAYRSLFSQQTPQQNKQLMQLLMRATSRATPPAASAPAPAPASAASANFQR